MSSCFFEKKRMRGLTALLEHKTGINRILEPNPHSIINSVSPCILVFVLKTNVNPTVKSGESYNDIKNTCYTDYIILNQWFLNQGLHNSESFTETTVKKSGADPSSHSL